MARWKALEKTNLYPAHGGSRTFVLWAGKATKVSEPERGECTFLMDTHQTFLLKFGTISQKSSSARWT